MNRWIYNGCMAAGWVLASCGAGVQHGVGYALLVAGGLLLFLTIVTTLLAARR